MTREHASRVKLAGHANEKVFANAIVGEVQCGDKQTKKDVVDRKDRSHSVKSGKWWQVFLYARSQFESNTAFQGFGNLASLMINCIDAFPENRDDYLRDKVTAKENLQAPMRELREELKNPRLFRAFLDKVLFNGGEVDYLSILPPGDYPNQTDKIFHIFSNKDVVDILCKLEITNSQARNANQMDAQKVLFRITIMLVRWKSALTASNTTRQAKCRLNSMAITSLLQNSLLDTRQLTPQIRAYGKAIRTMRWLNNAQVGNSSI